MYQPNVLWLPPLNIRVRFNTGPRKKHLLCQVQSCLPQNQERLKPCPSEFPVLCLFPCHWYLKLSFLQASSAVTTSFSQTTSKPSFRKKQNQPNKILKQICFKYNDRGMVKFKNQPRRREQFERHGGGDRRSIWGQR